MSDERNGAIEQGAIALAFFNRSPNARRLPLTPRGFWKTWTPGAKEHYRNKVRAVLAAVEACDADAARPFYEEATE